MAAITTGLEDVDWAGAVGALSGEGWVRLRTVLTTGCQTSLVGASPSEWTPAPAEEGIVRQLALVAFTTFDEAPEIVREVGERIVTSLTEAGAGSAPAAPTFNMVTWTRYPAGEGFISPHRDPAGIGGVIATVTLQGRALFRLWSRAAGRVPEVVDDDRSPMTEWWTEPGDVVLLRGHGWPETGSRCPVHAVLPPLDEERMILTYRFNVHGPHGDYLAGDDTDAGRASATARGGTVADPG